MTEAICACQGTLRCLEKDTRGMIPGTKRYGKPKTTWFSNIMSCAGHGLEQLLQKISDR